MADNVVPTRPQMADNAVATRPQMDSTSILIDIIVAIILPPLGVFIKYGCQFAVSCGHTIFENLVGSSPCIFGSRAYLLPLSLSPSFHFSLSLPAGTNSPITPPIPSRSDPAKMSSGHPDPSDSNPSPRDASGSTRIAYSREFLISVWTSSEACTRLPVGLDASKLSELSLFETGSSGRYVAPFGRLGAACSGNTDVKSNQLDMHPGNQCRHNWHSKEHDGLLGSGAFPRMPCYAGPLASNDQGSIYPLTRKSGGYQPTRQYKAPPVSHQNVDLINTVTFGSFGNWDKDRLEEERKRRASFQPIRKDQHHALQENKKAPDSDKENLGDCISLLLQNSAGTRDPLTKSDKQGGLNVSSLPREDAIKTAPLLPAPTTSALKPLGFTNGLPHKMFQIQSSNSSSNSEIQKLNTEDIMESSMLDQRFSGGGIPEHLGHFRTRPGTVVECNNPAFSGLSQKSAIFDEEGVEIHLPEEDTLFSVHDFLHTQNTDNLSAAEQARAEGLLSKDKVADLNYRFQSLDVSGPQFHDQIDPNNLYRLFESRPDAEPPKRNAGTMFLPSKASDRNQQAPFDMPKAIQHGAHCLLPQDMKSMQHVLAAPGGPCAGPAAPHHIILQNTTMPGNFFPPQGFQRCAFLPQPVHPMPDYRTEMTGGNSFQMHYYQPSYGETAMMMAGPAGPSTGVNQAGAFHRPAQMKLRASSRQVHPTVAGPSWFLRTF
uniref:Uncharacterized protein n=1 Tax=Avena sativa TaxID=4498 RepID=A0ACD5XEV9_AVESA